MLICTLRIHGYITGGFCCLDNDDDMVSMDDDNEIKSEGFVLVGWSTEFGGGDDDEPFGICDDGAGGGLIDKP